MIVSQLFIKPARQQVIDFSDPYYDSGLVAVTRIDDDSIQTPKDLNGKTIGTETGTIAVDYIKNDLKGATLEQLPSINNALLALQAGRTDAVIYDTPALLYYAKMPARIRSRSSSRHWSARMLASASRRAARSSHPRMSSSPQ